MYIVGIDIGKRNHEASIMNAAGKQYGKPIRFANSHTGFNKLMDWVKNISGADDVVFGMEATGHYWLALYTHLRHEGVRRPCNQRCSVRCSAGNVYPPG